MSSISSLFYDFELEFVFGLYSPITTWTWMQMKGEKELIERLLQTEINIFLSIRDGSGLMQHMEDFYYITLLEVIKPTLNIRPEPWMPQNLAQKGEPET